MSSMSLIQQIITIALCVLGTMLTRFLPFLIFPSHKPIPVYIKYLGKVLPCAVFGMLVIYCLKDTSFISGSFGIPELVSIFITALIHYIKGNMLLSIIFGAILYMLLVQFVF